MKKITLSQHLRNRSHEICQQNKCTEDHHNCESYAYINRQTQLMDICCPDYFSGSSKPHAAIVLPWTGNQKQLEQEVREQCDDMAPVKDKPDESDDGSYPI